MMEEKGSVFVNYSNDSSQNESTKTDKSSLLLENHECSNNSITSSSCSFDEDLDTLERPFDLIKDAQSEEFKRKNNKKSPEGNDSIDLNTIYKNFRNHIAIKGTRRILMYDNNSLQSYNDTMPNECWSPMKIKAIARVKNGEKNYVGTSVGTPMNNKKHGSVFANFNMNESAGGMSPNNLKKPTSKAIVNI